MSKGKGKKTFQNNYQYFDSAILNDSIYEHYVEMFEEIALSIFEWTNLPKSMNARALERSLFLYGSAGLLKDKTLGLINTNATSRGKINLYGLPTELNCYSFDYQANRKLYTGITSLEAKDLDKQQLEDVVLVMNNWKRLPLVGVMNLFAYKLYECDATALTNVKAQKTPVMIVAPEEQRLTMLNLYNKYEGNNPFIFGNNDSLNETPIKSISTGAPFIADKVEDYKKAILNDALTYLGINNVMIEKKERLTDDEANSNNELINLNLQSRLAPRLEACKQFNELFGTNIGVRVRSDLHNVIKNQLSTISDLLEDKELTVDESKEVD